MEPVFYASENPNPVLRISLSGELIYANPAAQPIINHWAVTPQSRLPDFVLQMVEECIKTCKNCDLEIVIGNTAYLLTLILSANQHIDIYGYDISPRKKYLKQLKRIENWDELTSLANRKQFLDQLSDAIDYSQQHQSKGALFIIDVDNFRIINQTLGHSIADLLLQAIAERLKKCVPKDYPVARIGNDDFTIIHQHLTDETEASAFANMLLEKLSPAFFIENHDIQMSYSIGIALFPEHSDDVTQLISCASLAQAKAKKVIGNSYHFFHTYMHSSAHARRRLTKDLRYALLDEQLILYYQPQIDLKNLKIVGAEALLRWQHPEHGLMTPDHFTSLAQEQGLLDAIEQWVLATACLQAKQWHNAGYEHMQVAVNLSSVQFTNKKSLKMIQKTLQKTAINPQTLTLEITENSLIENLTAAKKYLTALHDLGITLAIDDFGTGYSSLSYLQQLPIDKLKIDKCFVDAISKDNSQLTIIDNIIVLGHKLKMKIIAEGVEKREALDFLVKHDCDEMQGFYFSEPLTAEKFKQLLDDEK